jgi:uncharacterized protein
MKEVQSCLYVGDVVHRRVSPVKHFLRYRVYDLFINIDELPGLNSRFKFLSYNRFNLFSIFDRHFGDGTSVRDHVRGVVAASSQAHDVKRIFMLCYPAVLGRVFNPLTTYYCYDKADQLILMVYEVSNTFGERHSYVMPVEADVRQHHAKKFYVSPFNKVEGEYDFTVQSPGEKLSLGVALRVDGAPVMQAWFSGEKRALSDRTLLRAFFSLPLQPIKVVAGIHWEALKLWVKGMRLVTRPPQGEPRISYSDGVISKVERQK